MKGPEPIHLWRRLPVGYKVILPFTALTLIVSLLASVLVSREVAATASDQVNALAVREEDSVGASFLSYEQRQLTDLRAFARTEGVPQAVATGDRANLQAALYPEIANQLPDPLYVSVVGTNGRQILALHANPADVTRCVCTSGEDLSSWPHVSDVLNGLEDALGPKYAGVTDDRVVGGAVIYTIGPVQLRGRIVGALITAEPVAPLVAEVGNLTHLQFALFSPSGSQLGRTTGYPRNLPGLSVSRRSEVLAGHASIGDVGAVNGNEVFTVPVTIRRAVVGYANVLVPSVAIGAAVTQVVKVQVGIFLAALLLTILVGFFVSRAIRRPLATLLADTAKVAEGNLGHRSPIRGADEFAVLASSFNYMTASLQVQTEALEASTEAMVEALAAAIDARDAYTHGHSLRVAAFALALASAAELDEASLVVVRRGCLVHDIGKIGVPDEVLRKASRLDRDERLQMEAHPVIGYRMLTHLPWDGRALEIVRHHHERWDGHGYPDALEGEDIPFLARLVAVADAFDAMTSHRHYRSARGFGEAVAEIVRGSGTQFDPAMVDLFQRSLEQVRDQFDVTRRRAVGDPRRRSMRSLVEAAG